MITKKHLKMINGIPLRRYGVSEYTSNVASKARHGKRKLSAEQSAQILEALKKVNIIICKVIDDNEAKEPNVSLSPLSDILGI